MGVEAKQHAVFLATVIALVGTIVWLVLIAFGFSAFAKARKPAADSVDPPLPVAPLAVAAAVVSLASAFTGPFVVLGQLVGAVLAVLALRDANPPTRTLARWVLIWASALLAVVALVAAVTLAAFI